MLVLLTQKLVIRLAGGTKAKVAVKNTWEKVAAPIVLEKLNWTGEVRKDRPIKKGVRKLNITKVILGNSFYELYVIMASNIRLNLGAVRSNKAFSSLTDSDFAEYTKQALRHMPRVVRSRLNRHARQEEEEEMEHQNAD